MYYILTEQLNDVNMKENFGNDAMLNENKLQKQNGNYKK